MPAPRPAYILYGCPVGPFAERVEAYYERCRAAVGPNPAHRYMPHCTLTGFFADTEAAEEGHHGLLAELLAVMPADGRGVLLRDPRFEPGFYRFPVDAPWLEALAAAYAGRANADGRAESVRPKTDLHLSLAYDYAAGTGGRLHALAEAAGLDRAPTDRPSWELRLYHRAADWSWRVVGRWPLGD